MYKLYGTTHTSTCAVKAALAEAGAPFEEIEITTRKKQNLTEEYRQINPRQQVPSLMLPDGSIMTRVRPFCCTSPTLTPRPGLRLLLEHRSERSMTAG